MIKVAVHFISCRFRAKRGFELWGAGLCAGVLVSCCVLASLSLGVRARLLSFLARSLARWIGIHRVLLVALEAAGLITAGRVAQRAVCNWQGSRKKPWYCTCRLFVPCLQSRPARWLQPFLGAAWCAGPRPYIHSRLDKRRQKIATTSAAYLKEHSICPGDWKACRPSSLCAPQGVHICACANISHIPSL